MAITAISGMDNWQRNNGCEGLKTKGKEQQGAAFLDALDSSLKGEKKIRSREIPVPEKKVPYEELAKDGVIIYNGVAFVCDYQRKAICLGDMSDPKKVLSIPLSGGGTLRVNKDNIGALSDAIGMFSPEDVNRIMRAIAQEAQRQRKLQEIEDEKAGIGERIKAE